MDKLYTMKQASNLLGLTVRYLQMLDKDGKIRCVRTVGGRRRVPEEEIRRLRGEMKRDIKWAIYARVSSHEQKQKGDLDRQVEYLRATIPKEYKKIVVIKDVGSGLNDQRRGLKQLMKLVITGEVTDVAITTKDRLTIFGFNYLDELFKGFGTQIHVEDGQDKGTLEEELVQDMLRIVTSFSGRLYGIRSAKRKKLLANVRKIVKEKESKQSGGKSR